MRRVVAILARLRRVSRRSWRVAGIGLALLAVALLLLAARHTLAQLGGQLHRLSAGAVGAALALTLLGTGATGLVWRAVLADLGSPLPVRPAVRVYFLGQLGKYLPGSLWPVAAQMQLGRRFGVPRSRAAVAAAVALVLGVVVALLVAVVTFPLGHAGHLGGYVWVFLALPPGLAVLAPPVLGWLLARALRLARRPPLEHRPSVAAIGRAAAASAVSWLCYGAAVWVLARDLGARGSAVLPLSTAAFALAWVAGFLVLVAPSGGVVRETALTLLLLPVLPKPAGLLVALVDRLVFTVADLAWGGVAVLAARAADAAPAEPSPPAGPD